MEVIQVFANEKQKRIEITVKFKNGYRMRLITPKMKDEEYKEAEGKTVS